MNKKKLSHSWFVFLQSEICKQFLYLENKGLKKYKKFNKKTWKKDNPIEGGGTSYILRMVISLTRLVLINLQFLEFLKKILDPKFQVPKKMASIGRLAYLWWLILKTLRFLLYILIQDSSQPLKIGLEEV